jgi:hypothetical protein
MSHVNLDRSQQADQRFSWQSIPSSDRIADFSVSEIEAQNGQSLSLLSAVSRSSSRDGHDCAPAPSDRSSISEAEIRSRQSLSLLNLDSHDDAPAPNDNVQGLDEDGSLSPSIQNVSTSTSTTAISNQSSHEGWESVAQVSSSE